MNIIDIFKNHEQINNSALSDRIKPVFLNAYSICREFGFEEQDFNYRYKNKIIDIQHLYLKNGELNAFSPNKRVKIIFKEVEVFDCTIDKTGNIHLKKYDSGDWVNYFEILTKRVQTTLNARSICADIYVIMDALYMKKQASLKRMTYHLPPNYRTDRYRYQYFYQNGKLQIQLNRDDTRIASEAIITYNGQEVFKATHFYPDYNRPFSSNTRCNLYKKGVWEKQVRDLKASI